jgi:hypothetical protein
MNLKPKEQTDREKVLAWLKQINETDPACIAEVIEQCAKDKEARVFYVGLYRRDCEK